MTFDEPYDEEDSSSEESVEDDCPCSCYEAVCGVFSHVPYLLLSHWVQRRYAGGTGCGGGDRGGSEGGVGVKGVCEEQD